MPVPAPIYVTSDDKENYRVIYYRMQRRAISGDSSGLLKVWDLVQGKELYSLSGHRDQIQALAVTPDGKLAVSASSDNTLKVWDLTNGVERFTLSGHQNEVMGVLITNDGDVAVSKSRDKTLRTWSLNSGGLLEVVELAVEPVGSLSLIPGGLGLVFGIEDGTLFIWHSRDSTPTGDKRSTPIYYSISDLTRLAGHSRPVMNVVVTHDGKRAISASTDTTLIFWDLEKGRVIHILEGHKGFVTKVTLLPNEDRAVSTSADGTLKVWDLERGRELSNLAGLHGKLHQLVLTSDGRVAVTASDDGWLQTWDLGRNRELQSVQKNLSGIHSVKLIGNEQQVVTASSDGTVRIWDIQSVELQQTLHGHEHPVISLALILDDKSRTEEQWSNMDVKDGETGRIFRIPYRSTSPQVQVAVERSLPPGTPSGRYRVETFIPAQHANTKQATYSVQHLGRALDGQTSLEDQHVFIEQAAYSNSWVSLGEFELNQSVHPAVGRVIQSNHGPDDPPTEIAFGPVRWVPLLFATPDDKALSPETPVGERLPPLDFSKEVERFPRQFVGREWVLEQFDLFLKEDTARFLAISGEPGSGKTATATYLVTQRQFNASYFIDPGNMHTLDPLEFSRSLAYQLSASLPDYVAYMNAPDLESVAQIEASSAITPTTSVIIEGLLYVNPDPTNAFTALVVDPLQGWIAGHHNIRPIVLLVDGLDEAERLDQPIDIPRLVLERVQSLPDIVRCVVTTRAADGKWLEQAAKLSLDSVQGHQDVKQYLQKKFTEPEILKRLKHSGIDVSELTEAAASQAGSNFLHATRLVVQISQQLAFDLGEIQPLSAGELVIKSSQQAFMESTVIEGRGNPPSLRPASFSFPIEGQIQPLESGDYPWLLQAYDGFIADSKAGYFVITGEWGSGKTSLAYLISRERGVDAEYYSIPDNPESTDPRQFSRALAHQLARKRPEYAAILIGTSIPPLSQPLESEDEDWLAEQVYRYIETQFQASDETFQLFQILILDPLWMLNASEPPIKPFVLLLDNLDAAAADGQGDSIADLVAVSEPGFELPPNLHWIITAEPTALVEQLPRRHVIALPDKNVQIIIEQAYEEPDLDLGLYTQGEGPSQRFEEIMAGISVGAVGGEAFTLTAIVHRRGETTPYLLLPGGGSNIVEDIFQPFPDSMAQPADLIGRISIRTQRSSSLIQPTTSDSVERYRDLSFMMEIGELDGDRPFRSDFPDKRSINGTITPRRAMRVIKYGAGSGLTHSTIQDINVLYAHTASGSITPGSDLVRYPGIIKPGEGDSFVIVNDGFAIAEDLGALVIEESTYLAVGVVQAISDNTVVCSPIEQILDKLSVELYTEPLRFVRASQIAQELEAITDLVGGPDKLGFSNYVDAFVRLIQDTNPPLTIGVYGAWGSGKSFLMDKISERLDPESVKQGPKRRLIENGVTAQSQLQAGHKPLRERLRLALKRTPKPLPTDYLVVWFKAWDYNASDKLWAGLVERILSGFESEVGWLHQVRISLLGNLRRQWRELRGKLFGYLLFVVVALALTAFFFYLNWETLAAALGFSTVIALLLGVGKQVVEVLSVPTSQRIIDLFSRPDYTAELGFMGRIRADLEAFARHLPRNKNKVVVFIDDLDRCEPEKAVEVLEAIKLLLELERFIVFLALDARIITQAIEEHYGKVLKEAEVTGYEYLDKIVQIPFSIPQPRPVELLGYLGSLLGMDEAEIPTLEGNEELPMLELQAGVQAYVTQAIPTEPGQAKTETTQETNGVTEWVIEGAKPVPETVQVDASQSPTTGEIEQPLTEQPAGEIQRVEPAHPGTAPEGTKETEPVEGQRPAASDGENGTQILRDIAYTTSTVTFDEGEQRAFLGLYAHLDTNPRRLKRLVNIYRLVRQLIRNRQAMDAARDGRSEQDLLKNPGHIMGWLVLCEQWPYASHILLDNMDKTIKQERANLQALASLLGRTLPQVYAPQVETFLREGGDAELKKLDLKYERLKSLIDSRLNDFTVRELLRLRAYTVNFNPALSAEVQLTLARSGKE